jgi:adenylate kinase family enzyme
MKIHIFGASGSGVTTLGKALSEKMNYPYFDSDDYYWEPSDPPFTIRRNPRKRNEMLDQDLEKQGNWILGGSMISWSEKWLSAFDLAVFLWIPPAIRLERLKAREYERYGEIIYTNRKRNELFQAFIQWASTYENHDLKGRTLLAHEHWMKKLTCPLIELRGDYSIQYRLEKILEKQGISGSGLSMP